MIEDSISIVNIEQYSLRCRRKRFPETRANGIVDNLIYIFDTGHHLPFHPTDMRMNLDEKKNK